MSNTISVLLIEDDKSEVDLINQSLDSALFKLQRTTDLEAARFALRATSYDLIITILHSPDTIPAIAVLATTAPQTPIVALDCAASPVDFVAVACAGAWYYIDQAGCNVGALERTLLFAIERRQAELDRATNAAITATDVAHSQTLARLSHELRTPLNTVLGFGQLLADSALDEDQSESVAYILAAGYQLLSLVNPEQELAGGTVGEQGSWPQPVALAALLNETLDLALAWVEAGDFSLRLDMAECANLAVAGGIQLLRQALLGLLTCVIQPAYPGANAVISCQQVNQLARIKIEVNNSYLSSAPRRQLTTFEHGHGAGSAMVALEPALALAKTMLEVIGASIRVASAPNQGKAFIIELPLVWQIDPSA